MQKKLILYFFLCPIGLFGQSTAGLNVFGFLPSDELKKDASEIWGGGLGLEAVVNHKETPLYFGGQLDFTRFGSELREGYHGPELGDVRYRRHYEMIRVMGLVRVKPDFSIPIFPYFDLYVGAGNILTRSVIRENFNEEPFDAFIDHNQWAFMYGFGLGYEFFISDHLILDLHLRSMRSSRVEYLSPSSVSYNVQTEQYDLILQSSTFNHINFGFGLKVYFGEVLNQVISDVTNTALSTIYTP